MIELRYKKELNFIGLKTNQLKVKAPKISSDINGPPG